MKLAQRYVLCMYMSTITPETCHVHVQAGLMGDLASLKSAVESAASKCLYVGWGVGGLKHIKVYRQACYIVSDGSQIHRLRVE